MKVYLITYDLIRPETSLDYARLFELIKSYRFWAKPMESLWLIRTDDSSVAIINRLIAAVDSNDRIFVTEVSSDWAGYRMPEAVVNWLRNT